MRNNVFNNIKIEWNLISCVKIEMGLILPIISLWSMGIYLLLLSLAKKVGYDINTFTTL